MHGERQMLQLLSERVRVRNLRPISFTLVSREAMVLVLMESISRTWPEGTNQEYIVPDKPEQPSLLRRLALRMIFLLLN